MNEKILLSPPHLGGKEINYIKDALESNWVAPAGPHLDKFEKEVADVCQVKHAVAMNSATSAIHIALVLLGVNPGDLVFCSDLTFIGSANPILYQGAEPVFIDAETATWNISPRALETALESAAKKNKLPKAIIAVNLFGLSCSFEKLQEICQHYQVPLIEDAAESLGTVYKKRPSGSWGEMSALSFNGNKIITSSGGGMLLTGNEEAAKKAQQLITQARDNYPWYHHSTIGYNYRMSNISAAIGRAQLTELEKRIEARRNIFSFYKQKLANQGMVFAPEPEGHYSNRWLSAAYLNRPAKEVVARLNEEGIDARHIWMPMHMQPLFKGKEFFSSEKKPFSRHLFEYGVCLPSGSNMNQEQQERVIATLINAL